jgi:hypothetical protein
VKLIAAQALLWLAAQTSPEPKILTGPEIIAAVDGKTFSGAYYDGIPFRETYGTDGKITYWDPRGNYTGTWSVTNNLFCTFYEGIQGACFKVEQVSANCYDVYAAANTTEEALNPQEKPLYTARGWIEGTQATCPSDLQS